MLKQTKLFAFAQKQGILVSNRFIDPNDKYIYEEDGSRIDKEVDEFIAGKEYCVETLVTNLSSLNVEMQLLMDIPVGSLPLETKLYTQVKNCTVSSNYTQKL